MYGRAVRITLTPRAKTMTVGDRTERRSSVDKATVSAGYPNAFLDFAVTRGADRTALLTRAGLKQSDLAQQDNRVPVSGYLALIKAAIALLDEPALALQFGEAVRMQEISIVGLICGAAETTAEVGRQLNRYLRLMVDSTEAGPPDVGIRQCGTKGLIVRIGNCGPILPAAFL